MNSYESMQRNYDFKEDPHCNQVDKDVNYFCADCEEQFDRDNLLEYDPKTLLCKSCDNFREGY